MESEQPQKTFFKKKHYKIESRFYEIEGTTFKKKSSHYLSNQQSREWDSQHDVNQIDDEQR